MYQLCLGEDSLATVIERVTAAACAVTRHLTARPCRDLVDLILRTRVRQTEACGHFPECAPLAPLWSARPAPVGDTAGWNDADLHALPRMFAAAAADLVGVERDQDERAPLEMRLATAFREALAPFLYINPSCGHAGACNATPTTLFPTLGKRRG